MPETHQILALFVEFSNEEDYVYKFKPYASSVHLASACKFLYWSAEKEDVLAVGSHIIERHWYLHDAISKRYHYLMRQLPSGAGEIDRSGKVSGWYCPEYGLKTPEYLRPIILKALGIEQGD